MKYTCSIAFGQIDQLTELAKTAEEVGFDSIALPDSIFYFEKQSVDYPYTADGKRMFDEESPWVDPLILAGAMGAVTSKLRFYTNVMKLGSRNPLLLARQVGSVANLTNNRFGFGVGIGWAPEEFEWCGVPYAKRGKRVDEMIEVIKLVLAGGMVEFHGEFYDFDRLQMSPAPTESVPFYVGGHTDVALRRAARVGDGWTSAMMTHAELAETIGKLDALRAETGRAELPFEIQAVCIDKFGVDGHRELAEIGVTDYITIPWLLDGLGTDAPIRQEARLLEALGRHLHSLRMAGLIWLTLQHTWPASDPATRSAPGTKTPGWRCSPTMRSSKTPSAHRISTPRGTAIGAATPSRRSGTRRSHRPTRSSSSSATPTSAVTRKPTSATF